MVDEVHNLVSVTVIARESVPDLFIQAMDGNKQAQHYCDCAYHVIRSLLNSNPPIGCFLCETPITRDDVMTRNEPAAVAFIEGTQDFKLGEKDTRTVGFAICEKCDDKDAEIKAKLTKLFGGPDKARLIDNVSFAQQSGNA